MKEYHQAILYDLLHCFTVSEESLNRLKRAWVEKHSMFDLILYMFYRLREGNCNEKDHELLHDNCQGNSLPKYLRLWLTLLKYRCSQNFEDAIRLHFALVNTDDIFFELNIQLIFHQCMYLNQFKVMLQFLNHLETAKPCIRKNITFLLCKSFTLNEMDRPRKALRIALYIYKKEPTNILIHHTLSHIYIELGKIDEGIELFHQHVGDWVGCTNQTISHQYWHLGILYLYKYFHNKQTLGKKIRKLLEDHLWAMYMSNRRNENMLCGIISLLWRHEMISADGYQQKYFKNLWSNITKDVHSLMHSHTYPFYDIHYVYALCRDKNVQPLHEMIESIIKHSTNWNYFNASWKETVLNVAKGLVSMITYRDFTSAWDYFDCIKTQCMDLGTSRVQRGVLDELFFLCAMNQGKLDEAKQIAQTGSVLPLYQETISTLESQYLS